MKSKPQRNRTWDAEDLPINACVIGWPISHSRSPLIHGYWLKQYGIAGSYTKQAVKPEDLKEFLGSLGARGFAGCNVTVPHKEAAFALADVRDASAVAIGAANTLWLEDGKLHAANTDGIGFMAHLGQTAPGWNYKDGAVVILGAGGAARAIIHGFISAGVREIRLFNRTISRADDLAAHFGNGVRVLPWDQRETESRDAMVVVNTTTLGMIGSPPLEFDLSQHNPRTVICDIVYAPLETDLLRRAREHNMRAVDGLGMLLHQAVPGFQKWFGQAPDVTDELRELIVADIEAR